MTRESKKRPIHTTRYFKLICFFSNKKSAYFSTVIANLIHKTYQYSGRRVRFGSEFILVSDNGFKNKIKKSETHFKEKII